MGAAAAGFCCGRELRTNSRAESAERDMGLVFNMGELQLDFGALVRRERNVARLGEIFLQNGGIGVLQLGIVYREKLVVAGRKPGRARRWRWGEPSQAKVWEASAQPCGLAGERLRGRPGESRDRRVPQRRRCLRESRNRRARRFR